MKLKSWPGIGSVGMSHGPPRSARNNGDTVCCNDSTKPSLPAEVLKCFELLLHGSLLWHGNKLYLSNLDAPSPLITARSVATGSNFYRVAINGALTVDWREAKHWGSELTAGMTRSWVWEILWTLGGMTVFILDAGLLGRSAVYVEQHAPLKSLSTSTKSHGDISQKAFIFIQDNWEVLVGDHLLLRDLGLTGQCTARRRGVG
jgi:hypothetical protein